MAKIFKILKDFFKSSSVRYLEESKDLAELERRLRELENNNKLRNL